MEMKDAIHLVEVQSRLLGQPLLETLMFMDSQRDEYDQQTIIALNMVMSGFQNLFRQGKL